MRHGEYNVPCSKKIPLYTRWFNAEYMYTAVSGVIGTFIPENSVGITENYLGENSQHQCA